MTRRELFRLLASAMGAIVLKATPKAPIKLEAAGLDRDGSVKPIANLSYTPSNRLPGHTEWRWYKIEEQGVAGWRVVPIHVMG